MVLATSTMVRPLTTFVIGLFLAALLGAVMGVAGAVGFDVLFEPLLLSVVMTSLIVAIRRHYHRVERLRQHVLAARNGELESLRATLEERVAARTRELEQ